MRVCIVQYNNIQTGGGPEAYLQNVISHLSKSDVVTLVTTDNGPRLSNLNETLSSMGVKILELRTVQPSSLLTPRSFLRLVRAFKRADVVYFVHAPGGIDCDVILARALARTPVIAGHHQPILKEEFTGPIEKRRGLYYSIFGFRGNRLLGLFDLNHVENEFTRRGLRSRGIRIRFIPLGIDLARFHRGRKFDRFTVTYLGRLTEQKGSDLLPEIYRQLREKIRDFDFIVAGTGDLEEWCRGHLQGKSGVTFLGYVSDSTKSELLSRSSVFVIPSRFEGFLVTGLEAIASGTYLVSYPVSGAIEYVREGVNGYLVSNVVDLVRAVCSIFGEGEYNLESRSIRISESVQDFGLESLVERFRVMLSDVARTVPDLSKSTTSHSGQDHSS